MMGDRDQKTQYLKRKTEKQESQLKDNSDCEEQVPTVVYRLEPTPALGKFEERKAFQGNCEQVRACEQNEHLHYSIAQICYHSNLYFCL